MSQVDEAAVDEAALVVADALEAVEPKWRRAIANSDDDPSPALRPLRGAYNRLAAAIDDPGADVVEVLESLAAAARGMPAQVRKAYVRASFLATWSPPEELQPFYDAVAALVAAVDVEEKGAAR